MATVPSLITLNRGQPINEYRLAFLFGFSVALHTIVDPLVTYYMIISGTTGYELNPFLRWALGEGLATYIAIHIPVILLSRLSISGFLLLIRRASPPSDWRLARGVEAGFGILVIWGVSLVTWNLVVMQGIV